jgi:hypothetical protein
MADSTSKQNLTAPVTILGRTMTVKRPTDAQVALMHRHGLITEQTLRKADALQDRALESEDPDERAALEDKSQEPFSEGMKSLAEILDIIGYLFDDEGQAFLVDQMKRGNLTATDLLAAFEPFQKKKGGRDAGPAKRVR